MSDRSKTNGKERAFPGVEYTYYDNVPQVSSDSQGMTKREVIAMNLEQGLLSGLLADGSKTTGMTAKVMAKLAVEFADALLEALDE